MWDEANLEWRMGDKSTMQRLQVRVEEEETMTDQMVFTVLLVRRYPPTSIVGRLEDLVG